MAKIDKSHQLSVVVNRINYPRVVVFVTTIKTENKLFEFNIYFKSGIYHVHTCGETFY